MDPALRPELGALYVWLMVEKNYHQHAREQVIRHVVATGTLEGAAYLDPEDRAEAEEVFTDTLAPVRFDSPAWDDPGVYLDVESLLESASGIPDDDADRSIPTGAVLIPPELDDLEWDTEARADDA
jgi:hypothetical protein